MDWWKEGAGIWNCMPPSRWKLEDKIRGNMRRILEIRAAEGGEDSALFTKDLAQAYQRHFDRVG
jgi:hypothetical protein